jgi:hypothetical protein
MLSFRENIPIILSAVEKQNHKSVLDIGAGMGKYGLLIREQYLSKKAELGELEPSNDINIDAVEDTKYLLDKIDGSGIYDHIYKNDVFNIVDELKSNKAHELILIIDVLEHWNKEVGISLIKELVTICPVLISTPKKVGMYKDHFYGDPRHHITQFSQEDFNGFEYDDYSNNLSHILVIKKTK